MTMTPVTDKTDSVKENLIAARALIDTPEKWIAMGQSWSRAIYEATGGWQGYFEAECAVSEQRVRGTGHASILSRFDRAISSRSVSP